MNYSSDSLGRIACELEYFSLLIVMSVFNDPDSSVGKRTMHHELGVIGCVDFSQVEIVFVFSGLPHSEGERRGSYTALNNDGCGVDFHQTAHLMTLASVENRNGSCTRDDC